MLPYNSDLKLYAGKLRREMTDAERHIWARVRLKQLKGCQFYRQKIVGNYIVDFFCPRAKLVIEIDGGQHYSDEKLKEDKARDSYLEGLGIAVLRVTNIDALRNINAVIEQILENMLISEHGTENPP
jgi:very-short-patch-repair endonuclease